MNQCSCQNPILEMDINSFCPRCKICKGSTWGVSGASFSVSGTANLNQNVYSYAWDRGEVESPPPLPQKKYRSIDDPWEES